MKTIGVIMAGGESTRFGEDKSLYKMDNKAMYTHVSEMLDSTGVCDDIVVSTNARLKDAFHLKTVVDVFENCGPVGGLYSVRRSYPKDRLIVVSCDTPFVTREWIHILLEQAEKTPDHIIISAEDRRQHPLVGVYQGRNLTDRLKQQIDAGRLSMRALFDNMDVTEVSIGQYPLKPDIFRNINYKSDIDGGV